jgi:hypothetical protein
MKKKFLWAIALVMMVCVIFTGCVSFRSLSDMPSTSAVVYGNGGTAVMKGNYIYFVDSYVKKADIGKNDNNYNSVTKDAIYRAKTDSYGNIIYNDDGTIQTLQCVVPKIVGYEYTNMFIFDDYIYYATPSNKVDDTGTLRTDLVDFCRARLDGSQFQIIYSTKEYSTSGSYTFLKNGDSVYLLCYNGTSIIKVEINGYVKDAKTIVDKATSVAFPVRYNYDPSNNKTSSFYSCVYFTRDLETSTDSLTTTTGNVLGKVNYLTDTKTEFSNTDKATYKLVDSKEGFVYYSKTIKTNTSSSSSSTTSTTTTKVCYYANDFASGEKQVTYNTAYTKFYAVDTQNNLNRGAIVYDGTNYLYVNGTQATVLSSTSLDVVGTKGDYLYYKQSDNLYRINFLSGVKPTEEQLTNNTTALGTDINISFDLTDDRYIYYFLTYTGDSTSSLYMQRVDLNNKLSGVDSDGNDLVGYKNELVGKLRDENIKTETDSSSSSD